MQIKSFMVAVLFLSSGCAVGSIDDAGEEGGEGPVEDSEGASQELKSERHCLVRMAPGETEGAPAKVGAMTCYKTIAEVLAAATGGRVELPASVRAGDITEELLASLGYDEQTASAGGILIGIDYTEPSYGGSSLTWTAPSGCYDRYTGATYTWTANAMPAGWDNIVSSARTLSYCRSTTVYDYAYRGGLSMMTTGCNAPSLSWMDNRTSSQSWSRNGQCFQL